MPRFLRLQKSYFQLTNLIYFLMFAQKKDCGYTLELPNQGGRSEYPQSMFLSKTKCNNLFGSIAKKLELVSKLRIP